MVPACCTQIQQDKDVEDSVQIMAADIANKARGLADPSRVDVLCRASGPAIDWLTEIHGLKMTLVEGFLYPGHSRLRMHAPPSRSGADLIAGLVNAAERAGIDIVCSAHVTHIYADQTRQIKGAEIKRPDGTKELIGCSALVLACNGFGGNPEMVRDLIPDMKDALYFGHAGNQGDAIRWGQALGAATRHLGSYQGHGSVAHPHGILISWALMMEGGIQINCHGRRFSNELDGYSEQARRVLRQPEGMAWNIFDQRLRDIVADFQDYRHAEAHGAVLKAQSIDELGARMNVPIAELHTTLEKIDQMSAAREIDEYGRDFSIGPILKPPFYAVKVTGSLFHTQGGLKVDSSARVLDEKDQALPNLFASGGAACGVSGPEDWGYLSGNGLLSAVALGRVAGQSAADLVGHSIPTLIT
jgi:fumarate reductase flavoprotein subunit